MNYQLTPNIDIALIVMNLFFVFFLGLVLYLRREDRREGYPLEEEDGDRMVLAPGGDFFTAQPKTFILPHGNGTFTTNEIRYEPLLPGMRRTAPWPGSPYEPIGNPLLDGVGPAAYANRAKRPDLTMFGTPKIVPIGLAHDFAVDRRDADPRGFAVIGSDGRVAGTVSDIWVDQSEHTIRYLEVQLTGEAGRRVLAPMAMLSVSRGRQTVTTDSITAAQFANVPGLENSVQVTLYEEERIIGYYGGGYLYSTPERAEPIL